METAPYGKEDVKIIKMGSNIFQGATIKGKYIIISNVTERIVYHEIGHVIGLMHEHQRPDSFLYITINYRKLIKRNLLAIYSFLPLKPSDFKYNYKNYIYDYYSIMHYNETESGNIIDGHGHALSGDEPSEIDIQKVRDMYAAKPLRITFALYGFN
ncbi:MAG: hypothetical protein JW807_00710 [Spirochaetes bacterium]|nr:hypothetical protein [Spirochaetota bacterium]